MLPAVALYRIVFDRFAEFVDDAFADIISFEIAVGGSRARCAVRDEISACGEGYRIRGKRHRSGWRRG